MTAKTHPKGTFLQHYLTLNIYSTAIRVKTPLSYDESTGRVSVWKNNPDHRVTHTEGSGVTKSVDFGVPVGLSYEYKNVSLDVRYYIGLTKIDKTENPDNARNRCLSITLGYRFHL